MAEIKTALLFPGQGAQRVGMGADIWEESQSARRIYDRADKILGFSLTKLSFEGPEEELKKTLNTQPAILVHSVACHEILREAGFRAEGAAGHSLGEYSAHVAAGSMSFEEAVRTVRKRGELMFGSGERRPGTMAAMLGGTREQIDQICAEASDAGAVVPANLNAPGQVVVSGDVKAVEKAVSLAADVDGIKAVPLVVSGAFHSPLMEEPSAEFAEFLKTVEIGSAGYPVVANVSAEPVVGPDQIRDALTRQLTGAVRWEDSVRWFLANGYNRFVEVGPGRVLTGMLKKIERRANAFSTDTLEGIEKFIEKDRVARSEA
jgi:[acyl-carrier-protein] S-malonyltransferase